MRISGGFQVSKVTSVPPCGVLQKCHATMSTDCVCACMCMCKCVDVNVWRWINKTAVSDNAGIFHGNDFCIGACTQFPLQMIRFHLDIDYAEAEETIKK